MALHGFAMATASKTRVATLGATAAAEAAAQAALSAAWQSSSGSLVTSSRLSWERWEVG